MEVEEYMNWLNENCKCGWTININDNLSLYSSIEDYIKDNQIAEEDIIEKEQILKKQRLIEFRAYPKTPVGFICFWHHDIKKGLHILMEETINY